MTPLKDTTSLILYFLCHVFKQGIITKKNIMLEWGGYDQDVAHLLLFVSMSYHHWEIPKKILNHCSILHKMFF